MVVHVSQCLYLQEACSIKTFCEALKKNLSPDSKGQEGKREKSGGDVGGSCHTDFFFIRDKSL